MHINWKSVLSLLFVISLITACGDNACDDSVTKDEYSGSSSSINLVPYHDGSNCVVEPQDYPIELAGRGSWRLIIQITEGLGCRYSTFTVQPTRVDGIDAGVIDIAAVADEPWESLQVILAPGEYVFQIDGVSTGVTITVTDSVPPQTTPSTPA